MLPIGLRLAALAPCLALASCITTPLENREWLALRTAHYDILSSLSESESERLAVEVERFRAAAAFVWGSEIPAAPARTRVFAFDDRGLQRPFALPLQRSYLLARQRGDAIVLRTGDGWSGDARTPLRLDVARRLYRNASAQELPPWLDEGLAQSRARSRSAGRARWWAYYGRTMCARCARASGSRSSACWRRAI